MLVTKEVSKFDKSIDSNFLQLLNIYSILSALDISILLLVRYPLFILRETKDSQL